MFRQWRRRHFEKKPSDEVPSPDLKREHVVLWLEDGIAIAPERVEELRLDWRETIAKVGHRERQSVGNSLAGHVG